VGLRAHDLRADDEHAVGDGGRQAGACVEQLARQQEHENDGRGIDHE